MTNMYVLSFVVNIVRPRDDLAALYFVHSKNQPLNCRAKTKSQTQKHECLEESEENNETNT